MAAARAGASSPSRPRSIRPGRSRARCATPRSCCARWPATIRRTPPAPTLPVPDYEAAIGKSVKGMKIGIPKEYRIDGMPPEIETLWEQGAPWLKKAGAEMVEISLPHTKYALPAYYIVAPAEASSNLARYDGVRYGLREQGRDVIGMYEATRAAGFGAEVRRRIMIGTYVLSAGYYDAYYLRAQKVRTLIKKDFEDAFAAGVDAILTPATPSAAFGIGEKSGADPIEMYLNDVFTVTVNMAGLPGISVPAGLSAEGLPLGLQTDRPAVRRGDAVLGRRGDRAGGRPLFGRSGGGDGRTREKSEPDPRRRRRLGSRDRHGGACAGQLGIEAVLRRLDRLRRRAEFARFARRCRDARHAAGDQRGMRAAGDPHRARPEGCDQQQVGVRPEELFLSRSAAGLPDQPVQVADRGRGRSSPSICRMAAASMSASSGCISNRMPARASTTSIRHCRWSI